MQLLWTILCWLTGSGKSNSINIKHWPMWFVFWLNSSASNWLFVVVFIIEIGIGLKISFTILQLVYMIFNECGLFIRRFLWKHAIILRTHWPEVAKNKRQATKKWLFKLHGLCVARPVCTSFFNFFFDVDNDQISNYLKMYKREGH